MLMDCSQLLGRLKDLCECVGHDGRPTPSQEACHSFSWFMQTKSSLNKEKVPQSNIPDLTPVHAVSNIGTLLAAEFASRIGAMPCGRCKQRIIYLNSKTIDEVLAIRTTLIANIAKDAVVAAPTWWLKVLAAADKLMGLGNAEKVIGDCIDTALQKAAVTDV